MGVVATLLPNTKHLQRLRLALRNRHDVIVCGDWGSLVRVCEHQSVNLAFVDIFAGDEIVGDRIRRLKQRLPRLTLIAYVSFTADRAYDLFEAGRQGVDGLIIADQRDSPRALLTLVEQADSRSLAGMIRQALDATDQTARDAMLFAVAHAHESLSSEDLARGLSLNRRTLSAHLLRAGFPSAQRLITWGRLIVAGQALEDRHRSAQRVASSLEFPSGSAFRNTCQRYLHAKPQEIRARGGAAYVVRTMLRQLNLAPTAPATPGNTGGGNARRARHLRLAI